MKFFDGEKKAQISIGAKYGCLTVISEPYYLHSKESGKHRRQHFDCKCDCGKIREKVLGALFKKGGALLYCSRECPYYLESLPSSVPEDRKKCKVGERYSYLTVTRDAFYHKMRGDSNRHKYVEVVCDCGTKKTYRDDKVFANKYKSCGCKWEYTGKVRSWQHIKKTYNITEEEYMSLLVEQNNSCKICGHNGSNSVKSEWLFVDHCHETGKVRGLLCNKCNLALGAFNDDTDRLKAAIVYLEQYQSQSELAQSSPPKKP